MAGGMSRADLVADLEAALHDALTIFGYEDDVSFDGEKVSDNGDAAADEKTANMTRLLDIAALDFSRFRQRHMYGQLTLQAGINLYPAPDDLYLYVGSDWGHAARLQPWDFPRALRVSMNVELLETGIPAQRMLRLFPGPTTSHLLAFGATYPFTYDARHTIGDDAAHTTVRTEDRDLLLLRGVVEALREISTRDAWKPIRLRDGLNASARNQNFAALYERYNAEFLSRIGSRVVAS